MRHFHKAIGVALLFFSFAVQAAYVLVSASGHVTEASDATGYLGYGIGQTRQGAMQSILGKPILLSWLIDTDRAGPDLSADPFFSIYNDGCAAPPLAQSLGFTLNGALLSNFAANAPQSRHCSGLDLTEQGGRPTATGVFDEFLVDSEDTATSQGVLDDGSRITKTSSVSILTRVDGYDYDFFNGLELDQSFVWAQPVNPDLGRGFGLFDGFTQLESCVGSNCDRAYLNNFSLFYSVDFLIAQVLPKPVPEPATLLLLGLGLCCMRLRHTHGHLAVADV